VSFYIYFSLAAVVGILATYFDLRRREIPNWVTIGGLAAGILAHAVLGFSFAGFDAAWRAVAFACVGIGLCAFAPFISFRLSALGGGDVKLLAAIGAICGPMLGIEAEFYAMLLLAVYCAATLAYRGKLLRVLGYGLFLFARPLFKRLREDAIAPDVLMSVRAAPAILAGLVIATLFHNGI